MSNGDVSASGINWHEARDAGVTYFELVQPRGVHTTIPFGLGK